MERFINPNLLNHHLDKPRFVDSKIELQNQHLIIESELAANFFQNSMQSYSLFNSEKNSILLAAYFDTEFKKKYKDGELLFIKTKNKYIDKSISLLHLFADYPLDKNDRALIFQFTDENYLEIKL